MVVLVVYRISVALLHCTTVVFLVYRVYPSTIHGHCIVVLDTSNCSILYGTTNNFDTSTLELDAKLVANYFQGLIGVLCWICELGWIDVLVDVTMLLQFLLASPSHEYLYQAVHIVAYLKGYKWWSMVINDMEPVLDASCFKNVTKASTTNPRAGEAVLPDGSEVRDIRYWWVVLITQCSHMHLRLDFCKSSANPSAFKTVARTCWVF